MSPRQARAERRGQTVLLMTERMLRSRDLSFDSLVSRDGAQLLPLVIIM